MDKYKFSIQDIEVVNPEGWKDFELRLKRDDDIAGLLISSTNKFTFKGNGYDIIKDRFDNNYNDKLTAKIEVLENNNYSEKYNGVIILTDVLFNLEKKTAQATIEDASFQGAIQGNKNIKAIIDSGMTKNGVQITSPEDFNLDYFIANGTYQNLADRKAYLLKDTLDFMVRFMTDDIVKGVQSAYLDDTANFDGYLPYITTGEAIRLANSDAPNISFSELITFLSKTYDLTFDFITVSGEIVMRIEDRAFFFQSDVTDTFRDLTDLTLNIDAQKIASHLEVGNNTTADSGNCSLTTRFFSFQKEDYALRGKGNVDKLINLTIDFVTDSNVIEFIVGNLSNDKFDDDIIIVQAAYYKVSEPKYRAATFVNADYCSGDPYYNGSFTNDKIINRVLGAIPGAIFKQLTTTASPARAEQSTAFDEHLLLQLVPAFPYLNSRVPFPDVIYDTGGYYNISDPNKTFYDIPFPGKYSFKARINFKVQILYYTQIGQLHKGWLKYGVWVRLERWNAAGTIRREYKDSPTQIPTLLTGVLTVDNIVSLGIRDVSITMDCANGDRILVKTILAVYEHQPSMEISLYLFKTPDTYFECSGSEDDGGVYEEFDPNSFKARLYKFRKNVSLSRTDNIRDNTRSSLIINELSDTTLDKTVWIEEMVNNVETGETSFTMIN